MTLTITKANGIEIAWESFGNPGDETFLLISGLGTQMIRWTTGFAKGWRRGATGSSVSTTGMPAAPRILPALPCRISPHWHPR